MKRRFACSIFAALLLLTACAPSTGAPQREPVDAVAALEAQLEQFDGRLYVYRDYADGWNHFTQRSWMGANGVKPSDMQQDYGLDVYSGSTAIRCSINFTDTSWGGYLCLNGALNPGGTEPAGAYGEVDASMDLSGAAGLVFYAKGGKGGERVEFFCGGLGYNEFGATARFADSTDKVSLGAVSLTNEWKRYEIDLSGADTGRMGNGFAWVATAEDNPGRESIEFFLDEIYYSLPGTVPERAFLASYFSPLQGSENQLVDNCAFLNDNALACIALARAGEIQRAQQIANAIIYAMEYDRAYTDGRLRNGYLCGPVASFPGWLSQRNLPYAQLPGFYHQQTQKWHEDFYMVSTDTGSVAWAVLALCEVFGATGNPAYLQSALAAGEFLLSLYDGDLGGYVSGYLGWEGQELRSGELNTQFNLEAAAAFHKLSGLAISGDYAQARERALQAAMSLYNREEGYFYPWTLPEGAPAGAGTSLLVTNVTAVLTLPEQYREERERALAYLEESFAYGSGFSCCRQDRSGVWFFGTAQVAAAYHALGETEKYESLLSYLEGSCDQEGNLYSASKDGLFSGNYNRGDNQQVMFYRRLHLGSTAWLALAQQGVNPLELS